MFTFLSLFFNLYIDGPIFVNGKLAPLNKDIFLNNKDKISIANVTFELKINKNLLPIDQNDFTQIKNTKSRSKPTKYYVFPNLYSKNFDKHPKKKRKLNNTPVADYKSNLNFGLKKLSQPKTPEADYNSNVSGLKRIVQPSTPVVDYVSNIDFGLKKLSQPKTPAADYVSNIDFGTYKII